MQICKYCFNFFCGVIKLTSWSKICQTADSQILFQLFFPGVTYSRNTIFSGGRNPLPEPLRSTQPLFLYSNCLKASEYAVTSLCVQISGRIAIRAQAGNNSICFWGRRVAAECGKIIVFCQNFSENSAEER